MSIGNKKLNLDNLIVNVQNKSKNLKSIILQLFELKLHEKLNLEHVINKIQEKSIDLKQISIEQLCTATYTEYFMYNLTLDDIFIYIIGITNFIIILFNNLKIFKIPNHLSNEKRIKHANTIFHWIHVSFSILYSLYMIYMMLNEKTYFLNSRFGFFAITVITSIVLIYNIHNN
jgi:hypothetical protein